MGWSVALLLYVLGMVECAGLQADMQMTWRSKGAVMLLLSWPFLAASILIGLVYEIVTGKELF